MASMMSSKPDSPVQGTDSLHEAIYEQERAAAQKYAPLYDSVYETPYGTADRDAFARRLDRHASRHGIDLRQARVIDVGCGTGSLLLALRRRGVSQMVGNDISLDMLEVAKRKLPDVEFVAGPVEQASFPPESADVISGYSVLHHLPDLELFFRWLARTLRPGGVFGFTEPNASAVLESPAGRRRIRRATLPLHLFFSRKNRRARESLPDMVSDEYYSDAHRLLSEEEIRGALPNALEADLESHGILGPYYNTLTVDRPLDRAALAALRQVDRVVPGEGALFSILGHRPA